MEILRTALIAAAAALVVGCAATPAESEDDDAVTGTVSQAITHGESDDGDSAVVALMAGGSSYCTGTLISPYVVVTAAHCVVETKPEKVYFGAKPSSGGNTVDVAESHAHPDFNADALDNDIAIVALATQAPVKPKARVGSDDLSNDDYANLELRIVGFGATKAQASFTASKHEGSTTITSVGDNTFKFKPGPSQTCNGDSGGPAFAKVNGKEVLVGVTSAGDADCKDYGRDMRIDAYAEFVDGKMKAYSATIASQQAAAAQSCSFSRGPVRSGSAGGALALLALVSLARRIRGPRRAA